MRSRRKDMHGSRHRVDENELGMLVEAEKAVSGGKG